MRSFGETPGKREALLNKLVKISETPVKREETPEKGEEPETEDLRKRYKCNPSINIQRESIEEKSVEQMWKLFYRKRSI